MKTSSTQYGKCVPIGGRGRGGFKPKKKSLRNKLQANQTLSNYGTSSTKEINNKYNTQAWQKPYSL
jgi:hypothetical protein